MSICKCGHAWNWHEGQCQHRQTASSAKCNCRAYDRVLLPATEFSDGDSVTSLGYGTGIVKRNIYTGMYKGEVVVTFDGKDHILPPSALKLVPTL